MTDSAQLPRFSLSLFGRFELTAGTGVVQFPSKKLAGLLAYLAYTSPQPQPRERLAHLLWGTHDETQARQNLRYALFRLRRIIGQDALISGADEIWLAPGVIDCDVLRFKALIREGSSASLAAAVDLYRSPLLSDLSIAEDPWSDWRDTERKQLEDMVLDTMISYGRQRLQSEDADAALKTASEAIQINSLREDAHRLMIEALTATGRKAEALKHYQDLVTLLKRELSTEPDGVTQSMVARLRNASLHGKSRTVGEETESKATAAQENETPARRVGANALEQRQLTVMVCNLIGAEPFSTHRDPEDVHDLIAAFHGMVTDIAARFDGFFAHYQGNGVVLYFGYPAANEHDAERAVRAGLATLNSIESLEASSGANIQASVGIATGLVVVGGKSTAGDTWQHIAIGEAPDLATLLQADAAAGEIVIDAKTHRLVGRMFDCCSLPATEEMRPSRRSAAWHVRGENADVSRFDARRGDALYPLVGRLEEIELLLRRWDQARSGQSRVVLISGEPGIGKSRIIASLLARLDGEEHPPFRYFCSPYHTHSALYPFIAQIEQAAGFAPDDSVSTRLDRLEALLTPTTVNLPRDVTLFAELVGIPVDGRYPALTISPQQKREMTLSALLKQFNDATSKRPILIAIEDAHWIDPTSLDLLERMVTRTTRMPMLLLVTSRPEFQPNWVGQPHVTALSLSRLAPSDSIGIIHGITQDKSLPEVVVEQILSRTDGVPLFIEELTRSLLDSGLMRETAEGYFLDEPLPSLAIPTTLQASLVARLDLLGSARDVATIGAAIGREFSHELIAAVSALTPTHLDAALARLTASGLISRRGTAPDANYSFKHALVQDAAYVTMLKSRRRKLHAGIAKTLVERFPALIESQPEIVAHHFTEAGLVGEAIDYWVKAGWHAEAHWANREAARFFEQALRMLETLPETPETLKQAIDLRFDLKTSLIPLGQFERIVNYLHEAESLAERLDDQHRLAQYSFHMCQTLGLGGNPVEAFAFGKRALTLADSLGDVPLQVAATLFLGTASFSTLDYHQVEPLFVRALKLLDSEPNLERFGLAGFPAVTVRAFLARIYAEQGKFEQGIVHGQEGIRIAHVVDDPYSLTIAYWCLANLHVIRGELVRAITLLEHAIAVAREFDLPFMFAGSSGTLGYVYTLLGQTTQGLPLLEQTLSSFETMGHRFGQTLFLVPLGEACLLAGRHADALKYAAGALTMARESGQRSGEAAALHLLGEASVGDSVQEHAEDYYREALALAVKLGMRPFVARCHYSLGKLYLRGSQPDQARDQLTTATTMYREMDMRFWLERAEREMRQL